MHEDGPGLTVGALWAQVVWRTNRQPPSHPSRKMYPRPGSVVGAIWKVMRPGSSGGGTICGL